ncbi:metal ABC transporter ATP-binding protein [Fusobacterium sp. HC1336]|jgi:ABC-type Mn2+/Zn2+ transport system ATPase subunit|uniref:metal ABC transporter ATP-binding protein n=1 Tax=Fusobacterium sp. HC1336 TaxID=3171169 RepID=UPI003F25F24C
MSNCILTVDDFCLSYKNRNILENLSFSVEKGDYLAIGGVPGSGKSTLIKSILGLINSGISGDIHYHNLKKAEVSYIPQNSIQQKENFLGSVREVVAVSLLSKKRGKIFNDEDWEKVDSLLKKLNLFDIKDNKINKLTKGQLLKASLAKHLINEPKLLFIDSPSSTLDIKHKLEFYQILKSFCETDNLTVIFITHNIKEICQYANKLLFLKKKDRTYYFGNPQEFFKDKE